MKHIKIKYGIFILMLLFMVSLSGVYSIQTYRQQKHLLIEGIDQKLYTAAMMARAILPHNYHDRLVDASSVTQEEFDSIVSTYNKLCGDLTLKYLWSLMKIDGNIVFTSSTSPDKKTINRKHAHFFEIHSNPEFFDDVLSSQTPHYKNITSKWGKTRMALVPFQDHLGRPYLFGASMELSQIDVLLRQLITEAVYLSLGLLCIGLLLSYILSRLLSAPLNHLALETSKIASGQINKKVKENGFSEQVVLARNFNQMVSAIKEKITALTESEKKYRSMMEAMDHPAYICSKDYVVEYMNAAMIKRLGYDATGDDCYQAMHGLEEKCAWCRHEQVLKGEASRSEVLSPKDHRTYDVSSSPVYHANQVTSQLAIFHDITEKRKMEASLQQAQKMEAIGTLAGGIAHDFNNILFPIVGHSEMLLEDMPESSPFQSSMKEIYSSALRAGELVQQILTFSRQEKSELKPLSMQPIIKEAFKLLRSTIPTTIEMDHDLQTDCGPVLANPTKIHQIIINLSTNAYHAMEPSGGTLKISLKEVRLDENSRVSSELTPGPYACLTVSDTGVGINRESEKKIFDPFYTTKEKGKGTGMGLAVVHGIVKDMNGVIKIQSETGVGTRFHIYFPVVTTVFESSKAITRKLLPTGTERILLVDDEESIVTMEKITLERLGYHVTPCTDSVKALELFKSAPEKFDMVITDMAMPRMAGDRLAEALIQLNPDISILICTGFSDTMTEQKTRSMGIKGLLLKPITAHTLSEKIRKILDEN